MLGYNEGTKTRERAPNVSVAKGPETIPARARLVIEDHYTRGPEYGSPEEWLADMVERLQRLIPDAF